jgi:hypothetical protein
MIIVECVGVNICISWKLPLWNSGITRSTDICIPEYHAEYNLASVTVVIEFSWVCLHELELDKMENGWTGASTEFLNMNPCQLQFPEATSACLPSVGLYCSTFSSATEVTFWENKSLELNNQASYMVEQYPDISSCGMKTLSVAYVLQWKNMQPTGFCSENVARIKSELNKGIHTNTSNIVIVAGISHCNT